MTKPQHGPDVVTDEDNGTFGAPPGKPPDPLVEHADSDGSEEDAARSTASKPSVGP